MRIAVNPYIKIQQWLGIQYINIPHLCNSPQELRIRAADRAPLYGVGVLEVLRVAPDLLAPVLDELRVVPELGLKVGESAAKNENLVRDIQAVAFELISCFGVNLSRE